VLTLPWLQANTSIQVSRTFSNK